MVSERRAFTLVELLVVISIIGILVGLSAVSYTSIRQRGRDSQRKNDLAQIKIALSTYYNAQVPAQYVSSADKVTINSSTDVLTAALEPSYIRDVPTDPLNTGASVYKYQSFAAAADFKLYATLENKNDTKGWGGGASWVADGYVTQNE